MTRILFSFLAVALVSGDATAQISGRVSVLEKGGSKRKLLQNILVYIDGVEAPVAAGASQPNVTVTSRNKSFTPRITAVPVGKSVTFPNVDNIMHNVFSISKGNRFDLGLYKSGAKKDHEFETPGLVRVYCNIHPDMSAFVWVMSNPYYAWVEPDGSFLLDGVPPGSYTVNVWSEEGRTSQPVIVADGGASGVMLALDVSKFKKRPHLNKFGKPYKRKRGKY